MQPRILFIQKLFTVGIFFVFAGISGCPSTSEVAELATDITLLKGDEMFVGICAIGNGNCHTHRWSSPTEVRDPSCDKMGIEPDIGNTPPLKITTLEACYRLVRSCLVAGCSETLTSKIYKRLN